jgi:hypothetical protein
MSLSSYIWRRIPVWSPAAPDEAREQDLADVGAVRLRARRPLDRRRGRFPLSAPGRSRAAIRPSGTQIQPNLNNIQASWAKKIKGINFDFLVLIEPFQRLMATPRAIFSLALFGDG